MKTFALIMGFAVVYVAIVLYWCFTQFARHIQEYNEIVRRVKNSGD